MKIPKILISKILSVVLVAISIGGVGYIGYSVVFGGGHSGDGMTAAPTNQTTQVASAAVTAPKEPQKNMQMDAQKETQAGQQKAEQTNSIAQTQPVGSQQTANTNVQTQQVASSQQIANSNTQTQQAANSQQAAYDPEAIKQSAVLLQNKADLSKAIVKFNDAMAIMTLDPYAPSVESQATTDMGNMQSNNVPAADAKPDTQVQPNTQAQTNSTPANTVMQNMGTKYDVEKMAQLHTGLYKMAIGKVLLDQLNNELVTQAELAYKNQLSPMQFYTNQYNLTVQYNTKLNQAFAFINEAVNLVNINPYVSADGLALDNVRMESIHQSVYKLAEGVAALTVLNDEFTSQSINLANMVQAANQSVQASNMNTQAANQNVQAANQSAQATNHNAQTTNAANTTTTNQAASGGLFANVNASGAVNIILIIFVAGLILGIIGFVFSLIKNSGKEQTNA